MGKSVYLFICSPAPPGGSEPANHLDLFLLDVPVFRDAWKLLCLLTRTCEMLLPWVFYYLIMRCYLYLFYIYRLLFSTSVNLCWCGFWFWEENRLLVVCSSNIKVVSVAAAVDPGYGWRADAFGLPAALRCCLPNTHSHTHTHVWSEHTQIHVTVMPVFLTPLLLALSGEFQLTNKSLALSWRMHPPAHGSLLGCRHHQSFLTPFLVEFHWNVLFLTKQLLKRCLKYLHR